MAYFSGDIYSKSLGMTTNIKVILPDISNDVTPMIAGDPKLLYLLHGLSANSSEWTRFSKIEYYAKKYNLIIITPEVQRSFYFNTAFNLNYFSFVAEELPQVCNKWFNISTCKENNFIAGESMGGYGAVKIGLKHPNFFAGIASLSGVLDIKGFINDVTNNKFDDMSVTELRSILGYSLMISSDDDIMKLVQNIAKSTTKPRFIQICGTEDFLYEQNTHFRKIASKAGYNHTYMEWQGEHSWPFWDVAIQRVLQFFCDLDFKNSPIY
jgi:S-formylglutathione hydrolase FrmB